ncbi:MAG: AI-2E family transporter [Planctomycetes bacterium]|nr:AI-2E family transporter [Planctomycetota bacterium]
MTTLQGVDPVTSAAVADQRRRRLVRWALVVVFVLALLGLGFHLSDVTNPLLIGLLLAYVLNPVVEALERRGWSRNTAVLGLFGVVFVVTAGALVFAAVKAADHLDDLRRVIAGERVIDLHDPALAPADRERIARGYELVKLDEQHAFFDEDGDGKRRVGLAEQIAAYASEHLGARMSRQELAQLARAYQTQAAAVLGAGVEMSAGLRRSLAELGTFFGYVLLVPLYTFFLLQSFSSLRDALRDHLPGAYRARIVDLSRKIDRQVAAFFRGKLMLALTKGAVTWIGLWIAGVPFAFFIGMGAGLLSVVPLLGPLCGVPLAVVLSWEGPEGWALRVVWVLAAFLAAEGVEAVVQPVILGREVGLSPLTLILSLFVFGKLLGFFGVLLAVPIACIAKILFTELVLPEIRALAEEPGPPLPAPAAPPAPSTVAPDVDATPPPPPVGA